jgi:hypothetical protein
MRTTPLPRTIVLGSLAGAGLACLAGMSAGFAACTDAYQPPHENGGASSVTTGSHGGGGGGVTLKDSGMCPFTCSNDLKTVVDCQGVVQTTCTADQGCANGACIDDPCQAAEVSKSSYGCDYYALKTAQRPEADGACFAAFVANTWSLPVHLQVAYDGQMLDPTMFAGIPTGQGQSVTYTPYDATVGIDVGQVAILFLSRSSKGATVVNCPMTAAVTGNAGETGVAGTGIGNAFHITSDYPVVAYQMTPFGGGQAAFTSATLLLPTSAWDTNYIAINAYPSAEGDGYLGGLPSLDVVASKTIRRSPSSPKRPSWRGRASRPRRLAPRRPTRSIPGNSSRLPRRAS